MLFKEISAKELSEWLQQEDAPLLLDVRTPAEMARGAIPAGQALPLTTLPIHADELPNNKTLVFYCATGARSAQACMFMKQRGYSNIYNLRGGINDWVRNGLPIEPLKV